MLQQIGGKAWRKKTKKNKKNNNNKKTTTTTKQQQQNNNNKNNNNKKQNKTKQKKKQKKKTQKKTHPFVTFLITSSLPHVAEARCRMWPKVWAVLWYSTCRQTKPERNIMFAVYRVLN